MRLTNATFWMILVLPLSVAAQTAPMISMDEEPHHHLVLKNDLVKVYEINLESKDAFLMHAHDRDDIAIVLADATTVNVSPGQADVLTVSKTGDVRFSRSPRVHSVRNIGQTPYRIISVDLLRDQTGAHNLCGKQVPNSPLNCPVPAQESSATSVETPQFETDQTRVTLVRVGPHQQAAFGETDRDELIVTIDGATVSGQSQTLASGGHDWIARGTGKRVLKNDTDQDLRVVTVAFKP